MLGFRGKRAWLYPQAVTGRWQRMRRWTFLALHLILFVVPWITVAGSPALLFDLPGRKLYALGGIFTARDTIFLLFIMLFLAFTLFFFTSLFGRLWCGFACPQTVFLDAWVRPVEKWIEGDWVQRRRRDEGPLTVDKAWRKALKWTLFALFSFVISMAFMAYFAGARALWTGRAGPTEYALVFISTAFWFFDLSWFREQFCNYLCPYARFQSALTDEETVLVQYDAARGEPRGGADAKQLGRCVECNKCVFVCPQGIDVRNGFQLECIACARCIDACDMVMEKQGHEGLVQFSSIAELKGKKPRRLRPRTVAYGGLLTGIAAAGTMLMVARAPFEATVQRAPGSLFTMDADGFVRNTYLLRVTNKEASPQPVPFHVEVDGLPEAEILVQDLILGTTESRTLPLIIRVKARPDLPRTIPFEVKVASPTQHVDIDATFKTEGRIGNEPH
jgi:cytochrome c oxidase accessory protein FixG